MRTIVLEWDNNLSFEFTIKFEAREAQQTILGFLMGPLGKTWISLLQHEMICLIMEKYNDPLIS